MNKQIFLGIILVSMSVAQSPILLLQNTFMNEQTAIQPVILQNSNLDNVLDFTIYGWVDLSETFYQFGEIVRLNPNTNTYYSDNNMYDRVLAIQAFQTADGSKQLNFTTYDQTTNNPYVEQMIQLDSTQLSQPVFLYYSYFSESQSTLGVVYVDQNTQFSFQQENISHITSSNYQVFLNFHQNFVGNVSCLILAPGSHSIQDLSALSGGCAIPNLSQSIINESLENLNQGTC